MRISNLYFFILLCLAVACETDSASNAEATGKGGSVTRFAISNGYLYLADQSSINVFDIRNQAFQKINTIAIGFGLETIFARGEYLYLGATDAMYIYSIAEPTTPSFIFRYAHIVSCDPVVVQGNRAYVTLSSGSRCNRGTNALEIIDITNPYDPVLIENYPMQSPQGLGVDGNLLFLCEGEYGLKVFNISNESSIQLVKKIDSMHAYDVIPDNGILLLTGDDGVFQYRYNQQAGDLQLLSKIPVNREGI
ncbi:MAG TPA: hypothetical protein VIN08_21815 [Ohtaekwangia sp.]|uniref:LVIVD repeat-containing protein n=1 Tax=Ohtaekwangia sp. TaxID=2066019 RepID=UPI002F9259F0